MPFAAITAASLLVYISTSFLHRQTETFAFVFFAKQLSQIRRRVFNEWQFLDLATDFEMFDPDLTGLF